MKKILSALVLTTIGYWAFPQDLKTTVPAGNSEISVPVSATENNATGSSTDPSNVNSKAVKNFKKIFKNVSDEKWYDMPDGYRAMFVSNGTHYRLDYDKNGTWVHTIRYIDGKLLPTDVRRLVASSYLDYTVISAQEITLPRNVIFYVILLEGQANWINIKVDDNEITELETIKKS